MKHLIKNLFLIESPFATNLYLKGDKLEFANSQEFIYKSNNDKLLCITSSEKVCEGDYVTNGKYFGKAFYPENDGTVDDETIKKYLLTVNYKDHYETTIGNTREHQKIIAISHMMGLPIMQNEKIEEFVHAYNMGLIYEHAVYDINDGVLVINCFNFLSKSGEPGLIFANSEMSTPKIFTEEKPNKSYLLEEVIDLLVIERQRAIDIAYNFYKSNNESYESKLKAEKVVYGDNKEKHKNSLAFIKKDIAEECRLIGNAISGSNAISVTLGETIKDRIISEYKDKLS